MKQQRINIKKFADMLGVSTATVSRAFSGKGRISGETRRMIKAKAKEIGYRANSYARNLTLQKSDTVAFFYPLIIQGEPDYFISEIMLGINDTTTKENMLLQVNSIPASCSISLLEFYTDIILNGSIAGAIIVSGTKSSAKLVKIAKSAQVPYIIIGHMSGEKANIVTFQTERGAELAGKYFKKTGRKNPAYIGGILDRRKKIGFKKGLEELGQNIVYDKGGSTFQHGGMAFQRIISVSPKVDSVFCANDILAIGFIKAADAYGLKIPKDIAVIGCDDIQIARYYSPGLTTIRLGEYEIGEEAVQQLKRLLTGEQLLPEEVLECELIIRESA